MNSTELETRLARLEERLDYIDRQLRKVSSKKE